MTSSAERQKRLREKRRAAGIKEVKIALSVEDLKLCRECYERAFDPGNSFTEFLRRSLVRGVVFVANSGSGRRLKKQNGRYAVTS